MEAKQTWTGSNATCLEGERSESKTTPTLYIGLNVHKEKTSIAIADPGASGEVRSYGVVATTQIAMDRMIRRIAKAKEIPVSRISVCYEAGGCGM
jgi:transposase